LLAAVAAGLAAAALLVGAAVPARALQPPRPGELAGYARDGTLGARLAHAHRLGNDRPAAGLLRSAAGRLELARAGLDGPLRLPPAAWRGMPTRGTVNVLTLLIDFSDFPAYNSAASISDELFGDGEAAAEPYESLRDYYLRSSFGQLELRGEVLGWYRPAAPRSAVAQTDAGREALIEEALASYDASTDFGPYDNDGDGTIDYLIVVWTGHHTGWSGFWWGYQTRFTDTGFAVDGKTLGTYSWQWEVKYAQGRAPAPGAGDFRPEVVIHETGHALGLPDYYDYEPSVGPGGGVGGLDMMDDDWGDHNAFSKFLLDWIAPTVLSAGSAEVTLRGAAESGDALVVMPGATASPFAEYYVVQNRQRSGNDVDLPGDGLLIWHVDARLDASATDFRYDNSYAAHKLLRLMEADGHGDIEHGNGLADAGDYYWPGDALGPGTRPGSGWYSGLASGVLVSRISPLGPVMTFAASASGGGVPGDSTPPLTTVSGADGRWRRSVKLRLVASDAVSGVAFTQFRVDGGRWTSGAAASLPATAGSHAWDGVHVVSYRSEDGAGNLEGDRRVTLRIDTRGPVCFAPREAHAVRGQAAALHYRVDDAVSPRVDVVLRVYDRAGRRVKSLGARGVTAGRTHARRFTCDLPAGVYTFRVTARDLAGNAQTRAATQRLVVR
jgi:M6 family metalloprotease-like protein